MMPIKDGFQFTAEQSQNPSISGIPVVVMTADGHIEMKKKKVGVETFLSKPLQLATLLQVVAVLSGHG
jgi:CheY-like chemotaxis protein